MNKLIKKVEDAYNKMLDTNKEQILNLRIHASDLHEKTIKVTCCTLISYIPYIRIIDYDRYYTMTGWYNLARFKAMAEVYNFKEIEVEDER